MKCLSFFTLLFLFSCSKKETSQPYTPTGFSILVKQNSKLQSGQIIEKDVSCVIMVWKADGKDFDLAKAFDLMGGYAFDKNASISLKSDYSKTGIMSEKVPPGRYLVFVQLNGNLYYSYTYFDVTTGNYNQLKKAFTTNAITAQFEDWNKTE